MAQLLDLRGRGSEKLPDGYLPDPEEVMNYLKGQSGTDYHKVMCSYAARYIEAGLVESLERQRT